MSYILDALKKAERERGIAQVPTLATVHHLRAIPRTRLWAVSCIFILCVGAALLFLLPLFRTNSELPSRTGKLNPVATMPDIQRIENSAPVKAEPFSFVPEESPAPPEPGLSQEIPAHEAEAGVSAPPGVYPAFTISTPDAAMPRPEAATQQSQSQPEIFDPAEKALPKPQATAGMGGPEERRLAPVAAQAKPKSWREAIAKMTMSVLLYSENRAERLVFINGRKYVEGDYIDEKYLLESIVPEGAVLSYEGERYVLRPGSQ